MMHKMHKPQREPVASSSNIANCFAELSLSHETKDAWSCYLNLNIKVETLKMDLVETGPNTFNKVVADIRNCFKKEDRLKVPKNFEEAFNNVHRGCRFIVQQQNKFSIIASDHEIVVKKVIAERMPDCYSIMHSVNTLGVDLSRNIRTMNFFVNKLKQISQRYKHDFDFYEKKFHQMVLAELEKEPKTEEKKTPELIALEKAVTEGFERSQEEKRLWALEKSATEKKKKKRRYHPRKN